jgi:hypothetical protein
MRTYVIEIIAAFLVLSAGTAGAASFLTQNGGVCADMISGTSCSATVSDVSATSLVGTSRCTALSMTTRWTSGSGSAYLQKCETPAGAACTNLHDQALDGTSRVGWSQTGPVHNARANVTVNSGAVVLVLECL